MRLRLHTHEQNAIGRAGGVFSKVDVTGGQNKPTKSDQKRPAWFFFFSDRGRQPRENNNTVSCRRCKVRNVENMAELSTMSTKSGGSSCNFSRDENHASALLPWDRFSSWIHCICIVTFDLELGQAMEVMSV